MTSLRAAATATLVVLLTGSVACSAEDPARPTDGKPAGAEAAPAAEEANGYGLEVLAESGLSARDGLSVNYLRGAGVDAVGTAYLEWYEEDTYAGRLSPDGTWDGEWSGPVEGLIGVDDDGTVYTRTPSGIRLLSRDGAATEVPLSASVAGAGALLDPGRGVVFLDGSDRLVQVSDGKVTDVGSPVGSALFLDPSTGHPWSKDEGGRFADAISGESLDLTGLLAEAWGTRPVVEAAAFAQDGETLHVVGWDQDDEMGGEVLVTTVDRTGAEISTVALDRPPLSYGEKWAVVADDDPQTLVVVLAGEALVIADGEVIQTVWLCRSTGRPEMKTAFLGADGHPYLVHNSCSDGLSEFVRMTWGGEQRPAPVLELSPTGIGPIEFGMTVAEAAAAVGYTNLDGDGMCFETPAMPGIVLLAEGPAIVGAGTYGGLPAAALQTDRGVSLESTADDVRAAYPQGLEEEPSIVDVDSSVLTWSDGQGNAVVFAVGEQMYSMFAGAAEVVQTTEYCSG